MQTEMIIRKLPVSTQELFKSPFFTQQSWSPDWEKWAKKTLLECNYARDNNIITKLEWQILRKKYFAKLGGIIGEQPFCNNFDFINHIYYENTQKEID